MTPPGLAVTVLTLVPRAELAGLQGAPPGFVLAIPADGRLQRRCEAMRRRPAEPPDLCAVDGVAAVVAGTVGHALDQRLRLARESQDLVSEHDVLDLVAATDVVDLALATLAKDEIDGGTVVGHVEPVAHVAAVAIEGKRTVVERVGDEEGDHLLG